MICLAVVVSSSALVACGGAIQEEDPSQGGTDPKTTLSAPLPASDPYGAWDLVALDGMPGGNGSTLTFGRLFLELRSDGIAIARRCTRPYYESELGAFRCADANAYECLYGTVVKERESWRVDVPDLRSPTKGDRGQIVADEEGIVVRYILPKYSAGHFVRVTEPSPTSSCAGP